MNTKTNNYYRYYQAFCGLPKTAQENIISFMFYLNRENESLDEYFYSLIYFLDRLDKFESPIEQIFYVTYQTYIYKCGGFGLEKYILTPQVNISKYRVDFLIKDFKVIVECDGHQYHEKTKEQVANGNIRDLELKELGYEVVHFSGSMIYSDALDCSRRLFALLKAKETRNEK